MRVIRKRTRPVTHYDLMNINTAIELVERAAKLLTEAQANRAAARVRGCAKSLEGARNHAWATMLRSERRGA